MGSVDQQLIVRRDDPATCEIEAGEVPPPGPGEVVVELEKLGLTSNNVTYAALGEALSYLRFFPLFDPTRAATWGCLPVWGIARIVASSHADLPIGTRLYGFFPAATRALLSPAATTAMGFRVDRPSMPPDFGIYHVYQRTDRDPFHRPLQEDLMVVVRPLLLTSLLLADHLSARDFMGAEAVIVSSGSSKTSLGLAAALHGARRCATIGLSSPRNTAFAEAAGVYDQVIAYDRITSLPATTTAVYVDVAGDLKVREQLAAHLGPGLMRVLSVGMTHGQPGGYGATASRAGEAPEVFSAPGWMAARRKELGDGFSRLLLSGWEAQMAMASQHFRVVSRRGGQAIAETFADLARGRARPEEAYLLSF